MRFQDNAYSAIEAADTMAIVTVSDTFRALDFDWVKQLPIIFDMFHAYSPAAIRRLGSTYVSVGRG